MITRSARGNNKHQTPKKGRKHKKNQHATLDLDSECNDDDCGSDRKSHDLSQCLREVTSTLSATMERKETPQWNTMKKLCEMLTTMVQLVDEKQQQLQQDQKDMQEENAGLKNKLLKLEEELTYIKEHQKNGTMEAQPSSMQRTSRTYASVTTSSRADEPHGRDKYPEAEVQRLAERKNSQSWQVPKSHARNQRKYNRKYKQNVLILELDKKAMLQAGGAIMASGDPCRTVLTGKKKHANEPTSEETNTADPRDENRDTLTEVNTEEEETKCLAGKNVEDLNPSSEKKDVPDIGKNLSKITPKLIDALGLNEFQMHVAFQAKYGKDFQGIQFKSRNKTHLKVFFKGSRESKMDAYLDLLNTEHQLGQGSFLPSLFGLVTTVRAAKSRPSKHSVVLRGPRLGPNEQEKSTRIGIIKQIIETNIDVKVAAIEPLGKGPLLQLFVHSHEEATKLLNSQITYQGSYLRFRAYENRRTRKYG
eukprot:jgi/Bigna1/142757/aug1.72_g17465